MVEYGITAIQNQPSLFKQMTISIIKKEIKKKEKLKILKEYQDLEFLEIGIDDGIKEKNSKCLKNI